MIIGLYTMLRIAAVPMVLVLVAMMTDLGSGLYKAKIRGEEHTSYALSRTITKFISYEGSLLVACCIDVMLLYTHLWDIVGLKVLWVESVPVLTLLLGAFNCFIELLSIREKATKKADRRAMNQLVAIVKTLGSDDVMKLLEALGKVKNLNTDDNDEN